MASTWLNSPNYTVTDGDCRERESKQARQALVLLDPLLDSIFMVIKTRDSEVINWRLLTRDYIAVSQI